MILNNIRSLNKMDKISELAKLVKSKSPSHTKNKPQPLPKDFEPTEFTVICARGKTAYQSAGNTWFRSLVGQYKGEYANANGKFAKSMLVSNIVDVVRDKSPQGSFVRKVNGRWHEVPDSIARERVGQTFRDIIDSKYKSSAPAKRRDRGRQRRSSGSSAASNVGSLCSAASNLSSESEAESPIKTTGLEPTGIKLDINFTVEPTVSMAEQAKLGTNLAIEPIGNTTEQTFLGTNLTMESTRSPAEEMKHGMKPPMEPAGNTAEEMNLYMNPSMESLGGTNEQMKQLFVNPTRESLGSTNEQMQLCMNPPRSQQ